MGSLANITDHYLRRESEFREAKAKFEEAVGNLGAARTLIASTCERFAITEFFHNGRLVRIDRGTPRVVDKLVHNSDEITWPEVENYPYRARVESTEDPDDAEVNVMVADLKATAARIATATEDNAIG